ncbi:MAG: DUF4102 domain-containing protein [Sphingomonadales bacterium]|nr:MAG: DUF4102 domain-containing protein [Sphingomonadales bacterium]
MSSEKARILTDRMVLNARSDDGKRLELWDSRCPGLCLRIGSGGAKTWVIRYRSIGGGQPRLTLGSAGGATGDLSVAEARDKASEIKRQMREGADPALEKRRAAIAEQASTIRTVDDLAAAL